MPPPPIPKYFTILMTEMRDAINFVGFWCSRPPPSPMPPSPDATILNYLNDSEGGALSFAGFWRPPPPDATILNYLNDREGGGGAPLSFAGFWHLPMTPPPPQMTQYLTILMTERGGAPLCRILTPPPPYEPKILYYLNDRDEGLLFL